MIPGSDISFSFQFQHNRTYLSSKSQNDISNCQLPLINFDPNLSVAINQPKQYSKAHIILFPFTVIISLSSEKHLPVSHLQFQLYFYDNFKRQKIAGAKDFLSLGFYACRKLQLKFSFILYGYIYYSHKFSKLKFPGKVFYFLFAIIYFLWAKKFVHRLII